MLDRDFEFWGISVVEGVDLIEFSADGTDCLIPPLVTFLGGAIATILTCPRGRDLMMASASDNCFPSKLSSFIEMRWSPTLMEREEREGGKGGRKRRREREK